MTTDIPLSKLYNQIALRIITGQANIVGDWAYEIAKVVPGLVIITANNVEVGLTGEPKMVINTLVAKYVSLFGRMARDVCKDLVSDLVAEIPTEEVPEGLK